MRRSSCNVSRRLAEVVLDLRYGVRSAAVVELAVAALQIALQLAQVRAVAFGRAFEFGDAFLQLLDRDLFAGDRLHVAANLGARSRDIWRARSISNSSGIESLTADLAQPALVSHNCPGGCQQQQSAQAGEHTEF